MTERTHPEQSDTQGYSLILEVRLLLTIVSMTSFLAFGIIGVPTANAATSGVLIPSTTTYSCNAHCYGRDLWPGGITGGATTITVNHMSSGDGFVDDEIWVAQPNNSSGDCSSNLNFCWVEAGYAAGGSNNGASEYFFWADVRPCSCGGYHEHDSANLQSGDYGSVVNIGIYQASSSTWTVNVFGGATSITGTSIAQTMSPSNILIGQELAGTSGANAPTAHFTSNEWRNRSGIWSEQGVDGTLDPCLANICTNVNPPWAGWVSGRDPHNYSGGDFYTCTLPSSGRNPC